MALGRGIDDGRVCGARQQGRCLVRDDVVVDGPHFSRRGAGDVVGLEASGRTVGTTWVGAYGVLQRVGLGLMVTSVGAGLVLVARRMRRATGSWVEHESVRRHGSAVMALPVVVGFVLWLVPRFIW